MLILALAWIGCRHREPADLRIFHESAVLSLDPVVPSDSATVSVLSNFYEGLVAFDKDMVLQPALAVSWSALDERTWLFQLRREARFHDGRHVTAADVVFSFGRARTDMAAAQRGQLASVESVQADGESAVRIRTMRPDPLLLRRLTYVHVTPRGAADLATHPVGTGPYRFVRWRPEGVLEAEAFEEYWGARPGFKRVAFSYVEEAEEEKMFRLLGAGGAHVLRFIPDGMLRRARALPGLRIVAHEQLYVYYLWLDSRTEAGRPNPFSDRRVRQAVSLAIDRAELLARLGGRGVPAHQFVQSGVFGHVAALGRLPFDPKKARNLLAEAGYPRGFETTLVRRDQPALAAAADVIQEMLSHAGIRVTVEIRDWPGILAAWTTGRLPFFLAGWRFDDGDASSFLRDCLFTRNAQAGLGAYNPGYSSAELDGLIEENELIREPDKRLKHYAKLMRIALDEMPIVPLLAPVRSYAVSARVKWRPRLDGSLLAAEMSLAE